MNRLTFIKISASIIGAIFCWKPTNKIVQYIRINLVDDYSQIVDLSGIEKTVMFFKKLPNSKVLIFPAHVEGNTIISDKKIAFSAGLWEGDLKILFKNGSVFRQKNQFEVI